MMTTWRSAESGAGCSPAHERVDLLGVRVSAINLDDATGIIERWISEGSRNYVCVTGAHGIMESRHDRRLCSIHNGAGMVVPDGMPLVWVSRLLGKRRTSRVYGPDLMRRLTFISEQRGYRQFYYGGSDGVADKLKQTLTNAHPKLEVVGTFCPPFRELTPEEDRAVVERINATRPDIVWVGLSTPKQEFWMASHLGRIEAPVIVGVGAAFDFLAGLVPQAPPWLQKRGLEWAYRLAQEPRRLWRRYLRYNPRFVAAFARQLAAHRAASRIH